MSDIDWLSVDMVVHEHVGMHGHALVAGMVRKQTQHHLPVVVVFHDALAVVSTQNHVMGHPCQRQSGQAGHGVVVAWALKNVI